MDEHFVWVTTRRIRSGALDDFEKAWRPATHPQGMHRAFAYWSEDGQEITGVSPARCALASPCLTTSASNSAGSPTRRGAAVVHWDTTAHDESFRFINT
ncbi:hypothetical protein [Streptomyces mirabilis]|uniref:hypothetical protein n=1 Tax=Streptomyces mirabilis TaxID=68239 RepID=UPI0036B97EFE